MTHMPATLDTVTLRVAKASPLLSLLLLLHSLSSPLFPSLLANWDFVHLQPPLSPHLPFSALPTPIRHSCCFSGSLQAPICRHAIPKRWPQIWRSMFSEQLVRGPIFPIAAAAAARGFFFCSFCSTAMDSDVGKLFIGGISWETSEEKLKNYFMAYGEVAETVIMKDRATGRARGFGFVVFADPLVADRVVQEKHTIDGRIVEAKKAVPRDEQQSTPRNSSGGLGTENHTRTKKIFVGGLASSVTESDFRKYFEQFGTVTDVVVMYDHGTQRPRGFGFITYDSEDAVDRVLHKSFHELKEKMVEVKRAIPKEFSAGPFRNNGAGFSVGLRGGPYGGGNGQNFNASPGPYAARMDSRYASSQGGSHSPYGAAGYGSNGNFSATLNAGYNGSPYRGGSGNYGGVSFTGAPNAGIIYGGSESGYGGNTSGGGYGSSIPGRNVWSGGVVGYGSGSSARGYGGSGGSGVSAYGGTGIWGSAQSRSSSAGYGSSSFGYGTYDGAFGSSNAGYTSRSNGYGSPLGGYVSVEGSGSETGAYDNSYRDAYSSAGYGERIRKFTGADTFNLAGVGSEGLGSAVYNLGGSSGEVAAVGYSAGYAAGRQSHRGVPA